MFMAEKKEFIGYMEGFPKKDMNHLFDYFADPPEKIMKQEGGPLILAMGMTMLGMSVFHHGTGFRRFITTINKLMKKLDSLDKVDMNAKLELMSLKARAETPINRDLALKTINTTLELAHSAVDNGTNISNQTFLRLFITKMNILELLGKFKELLSVWDETMTDYRLGPEYEEECRKIKWMGGSWADWDSHPIVELFTIKGRALLELGIVNDALESFERAYEYAVDYPLKIHALDGMIKCQKNLGLSDEALSACLEIINIYKSTDYPKTGGLLVYVFDAYINYGLVSFSKGFNLPILITYTEHAKNFLKENKPFFQHPEELQKTIDEAERLIEARVEIMKENKTKKLTDEEIEKINKNNLFFQFKGDNITTKRYKKSIPHCIEEIREIYQDTNNKKLKAELHEFLECYKNAIDKSLIKSIRPMLEIIINELISIANSSDEDYKSFLESHEKIKYDVDKNNKIILNLWAKTLFLRSHFKNKDKKIYDVSGKRFFDMIEQLTEECNPEMHGTSEYPYNIHGILEDFHYVLNWYYEYYSKHKRS